MALQSVEENKDQISEMIKDMQNYLKEKHKRENQPEKLWENNFIQNQIRRREKNDPFKLEDHMRAMVYAMLSGGTGWEKFSKKAKTQKSDENGYDIGTISAVDKIFYNYDWEELKKYANKQGDILKELIGLGNQSIKNQVDAMLTVNFPKLEEWEKKNGIDNFYEQIKGGHEDQKGIWKLIKTLSDSTSEYKMQQMGVPLVCEYLRNIGYDIPKPDRHMRRIIGSEYLAFSDKKEATEKEVIDIVKELANRLNRSQAELDYILWSYCADGYGICTKENPCCTKCVVREFCNHYLNTDLRNSQEMKYLIRSYYGVSETNEISDVANQIIRKSFQECREKMSFMPEHVDSGDFPEKVIESLRDKILGMLKDVNEEVHIEYKKNSDAKSCEDNAQKQFNKEHQEISEEISEEFLQEYEHGLTKEQVLEMARNWLNLILMHMAVVEPALNQKYLPVAELKQYFHETCFDN